MRALVTAVCLFLTVTPGAASRTDHEIPARPGERLRVELQTGASVRLVGWDRDAVSVEAEFRGQDRDNVRLEVLRVPGGVVVSSEFGQRRRTNRVAGEVSIRLPRRFDVGVRTTGGTIHIENVEGRIEGETMGGDLELSGLLGALELSTMGGDIMLRDSEVEGTLTSHGGDVRLEGVRGGVEAATLGGDVFYDSGEASRSKSVTDGPVRVSSQGGDISVPHAPGGATLETLGGNIVVDEAADHVRATTMGGDVVIGAVDGWVRASTNSGDLTVTMVGDPTRGRRDVRLTSESGDVTLTVPAGLSMDIDISLAYTKNSTQDFDIRSDFDLEIRRSEHWDHGSAPALKYVYGRSRVGGGRHKIKIETLNGNVRLRRGS